MAGGPRQRPGDLPKAPVSKGQGVPGDGGSWRGRGLKMWKHDQGPGRAELSPGKTTTHHTF